MGKVIRLKTETVKLLDEIKKKYIEELEKEFVEVLKTTNEEEEWAVEELHHISEIIEERKRNTDSEWIEIALNALEKTIN